MENEERKKNEINHLISAECSPSLEEEDVET